MQFLVHVYHAIHHNLTTNSPQKFTTISKTPLKNTSKSAKKAPLHHASFFAKMEPVRRAKVQVA
jgi:hypothetical protein